MLEGTTIGIYMKQMTLLDSQTEQSTNWSWCLSNYKKNIHQKLYLLSLTANDLIPTLSPSPFFGWGQNAQPPIVRDPSLSAFRRNLWLLSSRSWRLGSPTGWLAAPGRYADRTAATKNRPAKKKTLTQSHNNNRTVQNRPGNTSRPDIRLSRCGPGWLYSIIEMVVFLAQTPRTFSEREQRKKPVIRQYLEGNRSRVSAWITFKFEESPHNPAPRDGEPSKWKERLRADRLFICSNDGTLTLE